jgi:hypothetical protein
MIRRVVFASILGAAMAAGASAQEPSPAVRPTPQAPPIAALADVPPPPPTPVDAAQLRKDQAASAQRAITRNNPLPARPAANRDPRPSVQREAALPEGGFANPGGIGRYSEYYTPFTPLSQAPPHPAPVAGFDRGGGPNRAEQIAAFQVGQTRARNIQNNINAYGRPYGAYGAGFGYGLGLAGGRGYGYPY